MFYPPSQTPRGKQRRFGMIVSKSHHRETSALICRASLQNSQISETSQSRIDAKKRIEFRIERIDSPCSPTAGGRNPAPSPASAGARGSAEPCARLCARESVRAAYRSWAPANKTRRHSDCQKYENKIRNLPSQSNQSLATAAPQRISRSINPSSPCSGWNLTACSPARRAA